VQTALKILLLIGAVALYFFPRTKNVIQLGALTAAVMIGFELVLTHWFYLYIPWFLPFLLVALLAAGRVPHPRPRPQAPQELVAAVEPPLPSGAAGGR
jgi:energy-coupling factor transporter transmembrane protein EcfT